MIAHKLVMQTAKKMAGAVYEVCAQDNAWYKLNPSQPHFINSTWPKLIPQARATLARMLSMNYPQSLKDEIADALIKDAELAPLRYMHHSAVH